VSDEEPVIEDFDEEGCLILQPDKESGKRVRLAKSPLPTFESSSSDEAPAKRGRSPKRRKLETQALVPTTTSTECDGEAEFGCKHGCEMCLEVFMCEDCKGDWDSCSCYLKESTTTTTPSTLPKEDISMKQLMLDMETRFNARVTSMEKELIAEKEKNLLLQHKLQGDRPTSPDSKGSRRRRRSRRRPRKDEEPLEAIDIDAVSVQPDWETLSAIIAQYAGATKGCTSSEDSVLLAEEISPQQSTEKVEERRKLREKHRMFLFAAQAVDSSLEACEDKVQGTWSSAATRPVSSMEGDGPAVLPPVCRTYLPQTLLQDIRMTGERAFRRDKTSDKRNPLKFTEYPKDDKVYTSSWLPADDKLFPQCHLSDESAGKLLDSVGGKKFVKPTDVTCTEVQVQEFAARGRSSVQAIAMAQQLLRVTKVLAVQHKKNTKSNTPNRDRVTMECDMLDRVGDILHQVSRSVLQTIHTQTLLLRNTYLKQIKATDIKTEEQLLIRDSGLFSSQVLPTQACYVASQSTLALAALDSHDAINLTLKRVSQVIGGSTSKASPPVNTNTNTGGGRGRGQKRKQGGWAKSRDRSQSAKRDNQGQKDSGFQQGANRGGFTERGRGRGRGFGKGRGNKGKQGF
jgi:uncharacterized protein YoaH (UPF0181 family)